MLKAPFVGGGVTPSFDLAVVAGLVPNWSAKGQSGKTVNPPVTDFSTIWDGNPSLGAYVPPTTDRIHNISSDSIEDNPSGSGIGSILLTGVSSLNDGFTSEVIILDGTNNVATVNSYTHIDDMTAISWGITAPTLKAVGTIKAVADVDLTVTALILPLRNNTLSGVLQVPRNKQYIIPTVTFSISRSGGSTSGADFRFILFKQGEGFIESIDIGLDDTSPTHTIILDPPVVIPPNIYLAPQVKPQQTNVTVDVIYRGYLAPL